MMGYASRTSQDHYRSQVETVEKAKRATKEDGVESFGKAKEDLHVEESGKSTDHEGMIEDLKNVHTRAMSSSAKEFEEEEILKDTNEGRSQGISKGKRWRKNQKKKNNEAKE
ncbi:unnamed protein product [Camellia sinensis]